MKFKNVIKRKSILIFVSIFFVHVIWLINTTNFAYAFHDLKIKLPLLVLPIIYGTTPKIKFNEFKAILLIFVASVIVSTWVTTVVMLGWTDHNILDWREASLFVSHIRLSLFVVMSICILFYFVAFNNKYFVRWHLAYVICIAWLVIFLILLGSITGIVILVALIPIVSFYWVRKYKLRKKSLAVIVFNILLFALTGFYVHKAYVKFYTIKDYGTELEPQTPNGNPYYHNLERNDYENGYRIWVYLSEEELKEEWNKVSEIKYHQQDKKGHMIKHTLIRYLTSLGLRKDSVGISKLSEKDIEMIENGYANYIHKKKFSVYSRLHTVIWEIDTYKKTGNPNGHSLTQRIEYLDNAFNLIKDNLWFGVGTGDINDEIMKQYERDSSILHLKWRHRPHNQYVTFLATFGMLGLFWILIAMFYAPFYEKKLTDYFFLVFLIIAMFSMLNEDTLETQAGVTFFAFFYAFFLYMSKDSKPLPQ